MNYNFYVFCRTRLKFQNNDSSLPSEIPQKWTMNFTKKNGDCRFFVLYSITTISRVKPYSQSYTECFNMPAPNTLVHVWYVYDISMHGRKNVTFNKINYCLWQQQKWHAVTLCVRRSKAEEDMTPFAGV